MTEPKKKMIRVLQTNEYQRDFPPKEILALRDWLADLIEKVPEEHRECATVEFTSGFGEEPMEVDVCYWRDETDAERSERVQAEIAMLICNEANERAIYERLRAKFERGGTQ